MDGREESRVQMTGTDPWKFPRRNRNHNSKWVGQGRTPGQSLFRSPGATRKPSHPALPVWLQGDLLYIIENSTGLCPWFPGERI